MKITSIDVKPMKLKEFLPQTLVFALSAVVTLFGWLALPEKIYVQIASDAPLPETSKAMFLLAMLALTGLAASMSVFMDKTKKWLALEVILALGETVCVVYNFVVL